MTPVGISILTNGSRRKHLERCIDSLLENCYYRPLVIGITDNGSTDDTWEWIDQNQPRFEEMYGVEWRFRRYTPDQGCAYGTNCSIELVKDCELQIHLESDFEHLTEAESGADKMWLHRAVKHLQGGDCDYLYLRRMRGPEECAMHWWDQWMPKITEERGEYLNCPGFWWSNNPVLFRMSAMDKVLPLDDSKDGKKGTQGWSQPELQAARPPNTWIHRWGMFVHERQPSEVFVNDGCDEDCKYGFWMTVSSLWCMKCDKTKDFRDIINHRKRLL